MKRLMQYKTFTIYESKDENKCRFQAFLPGTSPRLDSAEWEDDSLEALKQFIDSY